MSFSSLKKLQSNACEEERKTLFGPGKAKHSSILTEGVQVPVPRTPRQDGSKKTYQQTRHLEAQARPSSEATGKGLASRPVFWETLLSKRKQTLDPSVRPMVR